MTTPARPEVAAPASVLIVLLGAIGDVVCGLPLLQRLRASWPSARIGWAVEPAAAPLLFGHPALDDVIVFRRGAGRRALIEFLRAVRDVHPALTLDLQRHFKSGLTSWYSGAPRRIGFHWRNSREGNRLFNTESIGPVTDFTPKLGHFLRFADHLGVALAPVSFGLAAGTAEREAVAPWCDSAGQRFAALYVGSTWPSKRWLVESTARFCAALSERGLGVLLVGGRSDAPFARAVVAAGATTAVNAAGRLTLREVVAVMERAALAVGPDSGPMHIATAVGTPVVALFGPTSPARSGPWGCSHLVVRAEVPCMPCYLRRCPIGQLCMERISPAMVLDRVERALDEYVPPPHQSGGIGQQATTESSSR